MGWTGYGILNGDYPMDTLWVIEKIIGCDEKTSLFPLTLTVKKIEQLKTLIKNKEEVFLSNTRVMEDSPILAIVYMSLGIVLPEQIKFSALENLSVELYQLLQRKNEIDASQDSMNWILGRLPHVCSAIAAISTYDASKPFKLNKFRFPTDYFDKEDL